ncbi:MAG: hypothetical protein ABI382_14250 [Nakamurella sp.]
MKRMYYFTAGVALGVAAARRTRRAKQVAKAAFAAKFTPSAIAADMADAIAEIGQAVGSFASDIRMGAVNRRATYRPMIDGTTGGVVMVPPERAAAMTERRALADTVIHRDSVIIRDAPVARFGADSGARYDDMPGNGYSTGSRSTGNWAG